MTAARKLNLITVDQYLAAEEISQMRHEYVGGQIFAMPGGTNLHGQISNNISTALSVALKGKPCRVFGPDVKIKINTSSPPNFYYPDVSVVCDRNPLKDVYQERPVVVIEVLSPSTRRADLHEKLLAYTSLPSLRVYILVEQDYPSVRVHRRTETGVSIEQFTALTEVILLPEIEAQLPLADIYDGAEFSGELTEDE